MAYKEFQIIIGSLFIGLCVVFGSYIISQNYGFNACLKAAVTADDISKKKREPDYKPTGIPDEYHIYLCTRRN